MQAAVAIVSVLSSATVAITVAALTNRGAHTRAELQISAERFDELRAVLDEGAAALRSALFEMNGIASLLDQGLEQAKGDGPTVSDLYSRFQDEYWEVARFRERIALRLGPKAVLTKTYSAGGAACQEFFDVWSERWQGAIWDGDLSRRAARAISQGESAHEALLEVAASTIGPALVGRKPGSRG